MILAPILLFVYNRPNHTKQTVEALQKNYLAEESELFVFSDGSELTPNPSLSQREGSVLSAQVSLFGKEGDLEGVASVRSYIHTITGFKSVTITESPTNKGLARSIISGVSEIIEKHGAVIVLEDDLITSPYFLIYMNDALHLFESRDDVFSISGYTYPEGIMKIPQSYADDTYLSYRFGSWGWGSWHDRWKKVDWDVLDFEDFRKSRELQGEFNRGGEDMSPMLIAQMAGRLDSWAIRFDYAHFKHNCWNIRPLKTLVQNIGFDGSGVHCGSSDGFKDIISDKKVCLNKNVEADERILRSFFLVNKRLLYQKVLDKFPRLRGVLKRMKKKITGRLQ